MSKLHSHNVKGRKYLRRAPLVICTVHILGLQVHHITSIVGEIYEHQLTTDLKVKSIQQKQRRLAPKRNKIINNEVNHLEEVGFITEVQYPEWISNITMIKKKNGKWTNVCMDFTNLSKAWLHTKIISNKIKSPTLEVKEHAEIFNKLFCYYNSYNSKLQLIRSVV